MMRLSSDGKTPCPFINRNEPRCADRFSLTRLNLAFDTCLNGYRTCATYKQLIQERQRERRSVTIHVSVNGRETVDDASAA